MKMPLAPRSRRKSAFTLIELLVAIAVIAVLAAIIIPAVSNAKEKVRITQCASNLHQIHTATLAYMGNNDNKIPFAMLRWRPGTAITWDDLLYAYLDGAPARYENLVLSEPQAGQGRNDADHRIKVLKCPSDRVRRADYPQSIRSYAMPRHSMGARIFWSGNQVNWPPGPANQTGIGLYWNVVNAWPSWWNDRDACDSLEPPRHQPAVFENMILQPVNTILFTERFSSDAHQGRFGSQAIINGNGHWEPGVNRRSIHFGKINYLLFDGHVEFLDPDPAAEQGGAWTIDATD